MKTLNIQAGKRAMAHIRAHGLRPEDITMLPGAAGGPKGLGLAKLDEWLFADWLPTGFDKRDTPIDLVGASIGAWRFASACRGAIDGKFSADKTRDTLRIFANAYTTQYYPRKVSAAYISQCARALIDSLFVGHINDVLTHPHYRLHVLAVRGKGILAREARGRTHAGYALAAMANTLGRQHLRHFLDRTWFYTNNETPILADTSEQNSLKTPANRRVLPFESKQKFDPFHTEYTQLTPQNFGDALIASGSIPMILEGVKKIEGAADGTYWDGGIIDYHLNLPYAQREGIVLYPHFTNKIVPGWLDKMLPWRKAHGEWLDNVVLVSPTREYLAQLPMKKLPDRNDFMRYVDDNDARLKYWRFAMAESARLRDEFAELIESGDIADRLVPL
jgi:hypothetical protein